MKRIDKTQEHKKRQSETEAVSAARALLPCVPLSALSGVTNMLVMLLCNAVKAAVMALS